MNNPFRHIHKWETIRTIWPYEDGWGTHCPNCTVLDTGLSKEEAEERCKELNKNREKIFK